MGETTTPEERTDSADESGLEIFRRLHEVLFRHPSATQALFNAFVAEGRKFAETEEGRELQAALLRSDLAARGRMLWDVVSLSAFSAGEEGLPSVVVNEIAKAAVRGGLEARLGELFERHV